MRFKNRFEPSAFARVIEHWNKWRNDEEYSLFSLFNIPKKHPKKEDLDYIALSDDNLDKAEDIQDLKQIADD